MSYIGYLNGPLQMFGPENGVSNYLALANIYGTLILRIHAFSPPDRCGLYIADLKNHLPKGGRGHPSTATPSQLRPCSCGKV